MKRKVLLWFLLIAICTVHINAFAATLTLPKSLTTIGVEAFYGDKSIGKVVLSSNVKRINARAFANSSLTEINLPKSITYIDDTALSGTKNVRVTATEGTYAYKWAVRLGYIVPKTPATLVSITSACSVRQGPASKYKAVATVKAGETLEYWNDTITDASGTAWHNVVYGNISGWVSSQYSKLNGEPVVNPDRLQKIDGRIDVYGALGYVGEDMIWMLDLEEHGGSYYNNYIQAEVYSGTTSEIYIYKKNSAYCIQGATYGMTVADAEKQLLSRGWKLYTVFDEEHDLHQRIYTNSKNHQISLYTYDSSNFKKVEIIVVWNYMYFD